MDKNLYHAEGGELLNGKIKVRLCGEPGVFEIMARDMAETIEANNRKGEKTVFIVPVGPVGQYPLFVEEALKRKLDMSKVWFINMDEYLGEDGKWIAKDDKLSFRGFMEREVYSKLGELAPPKGQRIFPDPENPGMVMEAIDSLGKVDVCYGGIGINGHVAFNEPGDTTPEDFAARRTRVVEISPETRTANAIGDLGGAIDAMPTHAVTIGMAEILRAERIVLGIFRPWHKAVLRRAIFDSATASFPVTLLQRHKDAVILAGEQLSERAF